MGRRRSAATLTGFLLFVATTFESSRVSAQWFWSNAAASCGSSAVMTDLQKQLDDIGAAGAKSNLMFIRAEVSIKVRISNAREFKPYENSIKRRYCAVDQEFLIDMKTQEVEARRILEYSFGGVGSKIGVWHVNSRYPVQHFCVQKLENGTSRITIASDTSAREC